jgi:hypothetical protein
MISEWMDEARQVAAQCWCDPETSSRVMDPELAEAFSRRLALWMSTAAQNQRNANYYRGLVVRCGQEMDDGNESEDVLCDKIPELVERLCSANRKFKETLMTDIVDEALRLVVLEPLDDITVKGVVKSIESAFGEDTKVLCSYPEDYKSFTVHLPEYDIKRTIIGKGLFNYEIV